MTVKARMLKVIEQMPDDASVDQAIERLYLLRKIEIGLQQAEAGDVIDHDEFLKQISDDE